MKICCRKNSYYKKWAFTRIEEDVTAIEDGLQNQ